MYGLSPSEDLSVLHGYVLTFVGFGQHQMQLGFSGPPDCSISVESDYAVSTADESAQTFHDPVTGAPRLLPLLGRTIVEATVPTMGTTRVTFDDGSTVEVFDSESHYESYQIHLPDRLIVV